MTKLGMWAFLGVAALAILAGAFAATSTSRADDDLSSSLIGSWRGTRHAPGTTAVRHNLVSFLPGGVVVGAGSSVYVTGLNMGTGNVVQTDFIGTWISEGHGNFVAHLIANLSEAPVSKGMILGTENVTFRFHLEAEKGGGKQLKGTTESTVLDTEGKVVSQSSAGVTWDATPLTITSNGYN